MRTRTAILLSCVLVASARAGSRNFDWPGHGTIRVELPSGWKVTGQPAEDVGFALSARPEVPVAALLQITLVNTPADKPVVAAELPDRLHASLLPYIEQSVEKEFRPMALKCRQGKGWYAELTDASLVGRPAVSEDYKVMRNALVALDRQTLVIATMQFDDPAAAAAGEMLAIVASLRFERGPAGRAVSAAAPEATVVAAR